MNITYNLFLLLICLSLSFKTSAQNVNTIRQWDVFEIPMESNRNYNNPYNQIPLNPAEDLVKVVFRGIQGDAKGKEISVVGFWDGKNSWKARFAAPATGVWEYKSTSKDGGLNNIRGRVEVIEWKKDEQASNPTRKGFIQIMENGDQANRYFQYADGTPFLWIGDTWWNWTKRGIHFSTFSNLVDDRAAKGYNLGQLFVAANGWGSASSLLDSTFTVLDVNHIKKVDSMISYSNNQGITVWIHGWWSRKNLNETAGEEKMKRWWRYLVHRYGAYNVIWVLAGEYNLENYGGLGLQFWKDLGQMIKNEDPYKRIVGAHNTPPNWRGGMEAPQWSTAEVLHDEPWLDYNQIQVGHGRMANEMIPDIVKESYEKDPPKPVVVTEPWYEFVEGNPTGRDVRFGAWTAILSGAAGHTYGGGHVWLANVPEAPGGGGAWPIEKGFERTTLDYEGAVSMGHIASFFKDIAYWKMAPHPELVKEYPDKYCLANPGNEYVIYLRWGGTLKVDLAPSNSTDQFDYYYYNPKTGESTESKTVEGGKTQFFSSPGGYPGTLEFQDWVLHIKKR